MDYAADFPIITNRNDMGNKKPIRFSNHYSSRGGRVMIYKVWVCLEAEYDYIKADSAEEAFQIARNVAIAGGSWAWSAEKVRDRKKRATLAATTRRRAVMASRVHNATRITCIWTAIKKDRRLAMADYLDRAELCKAIDAHFHAVADDILDSSIIKQTYKMAHEHIKDVVRHLHAADELAK